MNYKVLAYDEAAFTLFAFKRALRDRDQFTPAMVQFYERSVEILSKKLPRLKEQANDSRSYADRSRDRISEIPTTWPSH